MPVRYFDGSTEVQLGDRVALKVLFRRRVGRVVYVPGLSAFNPEFEYNGMRWVGIRLEDRSLPATPILTKPGNLKRKSNLFSVMAQLVSSLPIPRESSKNMEKDPVCSLVICDSNCLKSGQSGFFLVASHENEKVHCANP